ncbi:outer membrane beta-barrel protein [Fulvivirga sedimenti]|uniref:PorT family protein n=1 Tax=Fulvivirga sedimenti TaxID=2879465 RepID=A0A9X1HQ22_9BACT|nr:outer membrane beta-barrel protein [Fulvivirga sedimenti]MCA6074554.1 PorT family protein [Fulvivirga sedimenti]MCA6075731.1 PorT family protein [Fulvivirga sedimenti]MCA6076859.1 PorT family protein [Fulvivirga sedimenti]
MDKENNDIEKFFEKRLRQVEFPFNEGDWENLEKRLDEDDLLAGGIRNNGVRPWGWIALVILAFLSGWIMHSYFTVENAGGEDNSPQIAEENPKTEEMGDTRSDAAVSRQADDSQNTQRIRSEITDNSEGSNPATETDSGTIARPGDSKQSSDSGDLANNQPKPGFERESDEINHNLNHNNPGNTKVETISDEQLNAGDINLRQEGGKLPELPAGLLHSWEPKPFEPFPQSLNLWMPEKVYISIPDNTIQQLSVGENEDEEREDTFSNWSIGLGISPDFNSTGNGDPWRVSGEFGLQVFYTFSRQWSVNTGLLYSNKRYLASGDQYNPPEGYWDYYTDGMIPDEVRAVCGILDLPINLNFIINPDSKIRFFIGAGISNYFILNEDYKYDFSVPNYYGSEGWETTENSSAWLGYFNGSFGVESTIGRNLSLRLEPYAKIPMKQVGFGKVDLFGSGMMFTIRKHFKINE